MKQTIVAIYIVVKVVVILYTFKLKNNSSFEVVVYCVPTSVGDMLECMYIPGLKIYTCIML